MRYALGTHSLAAYHEAGHAVIGLLEGLRLEAVDVSGAAGGTRYSFNSAGIDSLEGQARFALAGKVAEDIYRYDAPHVYTVDQIRSMASNDKDLLEYALEALDADVARTWALVDETVSLVRRTWPAIEKLARALEHRKRMTGAEICELLDITMPAPALPPRAGKRTAPPLPAGKPATAEELRQVSARAAQRGQAQLAALLQATIARQRGGIQHATLQ